MDESSVMSVLRFDQSVTWPEANFSIIRPEQG